MDNDYGDRVAEIKDLIQDVSNVIDKYPEMKNSNFGLFYQDGRLGFMDLDAVAKKVELAKESLTETEEDVDRKEE